MIGNRAARRHSGVYLLLVLTGVTLTRAQSMEYGAAAVATGASISAHDLSGNRNPAFAGWSRLSTISAWSGTLYGLNDLRLSGISASLGLDKDRALGFKAVLTTLSFDRFNQLTLDSGLSIAPALNSLRDLRLGFGLSWSRIPRAITGHQSRITTKIGAHVPLSPAIQIDIVLDGPFAARSTSLRHRTTFGLAYKASSGSALGYEVDRVAGYEAAHGFSADILLVGFFHALFGWRSNPASWSTGFQFKVKALHIAFGLDNHHALGGSNVFEVQLIP